MIQNIKSWWRPVWSGLMIDSKGKHLRQMGMSIWLYLYLLMIAESKSGTLVRFLNEISQETGIKKNTVKKWLAVLKSKGYVQCQKTSKGLLIHICHYKKTKRDSELPVRYPASSYSESQSAPSEEGQKQLRTPYFNGKFAKVSEVLDRIDIKRYIHIDNIDREINSFNNQKEKFVPRNKEGLLALDIARGLGDLKGIKYYFSVCKKYPEPVIRRIYSQVKELPDEKVKNKGALFNHLIQKLCANQNNPRGY